MAISAATILAVLSAGETLITDAVALYKTERDALAAKDQAAIDAQIAQISSKCSTDYGRVDAELAAAEDEAQPSPQPAAPAPAPAAPAPGT